MAGLSIITVQAVFCDEKPSLLCSLLNVFECTTLEILDLEPCFELHDTIQHTVTPLKARLMK